MLSDHLIFYFPLLLSPSIFPSFRVFSSGSALCTPISFFFFFVMLGADLGGSGEKEYYFSAGALWSRRFFSEVL